jgi:dihydropteroate synthase
MKTLNCKGKILMLDSPLVMGILNVTPDSFFDGGKYSNSIDIIMQADKMLFEGAAIIDIGGFSTRPNAEMISEAEELSRILPATELLHNHFPDAVLSIDTFRSNVAEAAIKNGVSVINDISGGTEDERIFEVAAKYNCPLILMHKQGKLHNMHQHTIYNDVLNDILDFFTKQLKKAKDAGVKDVIIDVGFGFSKTIEQNYFLLKNLAVFKLLDKPVLAGISRKSMLYKMLGTTAQQSLNATTAANMIALQQGAGILRVHDVKEAVECVAIWKAVNGIK